MDNYQSILVISILVLSFLSLFIIIYHERRNITELEIFRKKVAKHYREKKIIEFDA